MASRNDAESFIKNRLTEEDHTYLMKVAHQLNAIGHQKALKAAQMCADQEKIKANRMKESKRIRKRDQQAAIVMNTFKDLSRTDVEIDCLKNEALVLC